MVSMRFLCPNCWSYVLSNALTCPTCDAVFDGGAEWQPVPDNGRPHPAPHVPAQVSRREQTPEQREDEHRGWLGKAGRLLFGGFGVLIGVLVVWGSVLRDLRAMEINRHWPAQYWMDVLGAPVLAASLLAFGLSQWLQVAWVGEDAEFDPRLWAQLTPRQRRRHLWRRAAASDLAVLLWLVLNAALLGVINVNLLQGMVEGSLPAADLVVPVLAGLAAVAGAFIAGRDILRSQSGPARPGQSETGGPWVHVWRGHYQWWATLYALLAGLAGGGAAILLLRVLFVLVSGAWRDGVRFQGALLSAIMLAFACALVRAHWTSRRALHRLCLVERISFSLARKTLHPLTLVGEVHFEPPLRDADRKRQWKALLHVDGGLGVGDRGDGDDVMQASVQIAHDGATGNFTLRGDMPPREETHRASLRLRLSCGDVWCINLQLPREIALPD